MKNSFSCRKNEIMGTTRKLWSQHVYRTRFFIISTAEEIGDLKCVTNWLLRNPADFADMLKCFYGDEKADKFNALLTEHLKIGGELVNAAKDKNTAKADMLRRKWYINASDISDFLADINPCWSARKWRSMMDCHLKMTEKEAALRLNKEYPKDIEIFDCIENEALEMADYMSAGIIQQFCCN